MLSLTVSGGKSTENYTQVKVPLPSQQQVIQVTAAERTPERRDRADRTSHQWVGIYRTWHLRELTLHAIPATLHHSFQAV